MISIDGLTVEFGGTTLFSDLNFQINEKDRIALMGKNGAGKSTLLKILAGVRQPTRGKVTAPKDWVIAYLPQHLMTEDGRTVFEEASQAFAHLKEMEEEIERMNNELATRTDYESDSYMALIEKVAANLLIRVHLLRKLLHTQLNETFACLILVEGDDDTTHIKNHSFNHIIILKTLYSLSCQNSSSLFFLASESEAILACSS